MQGLSLRNVLIPKTSRLSFQVAATLYSLVYAAVAIIGRSETTIELTSLEGNLLLTGATLATWYLAAGVYLSRREHAKRRSLAEMVNYQPGSNNYTSIDYRDLGIVRSQIPLVVPLAVGIALLMFAAMIAGLGLAGLAVASTEVTIVPLVILFGALGIWLIVHYISRARRERPGLSHAERFVQFAIANKLEYITSSGKDQILDSDFGPLTFRRVNEDVRVTSVLRGVYRGKAFEFLNIYAEGYTNRKYRYYGVLRRPVEPGPAVADGTQLENHLETVSDIRLVDDLVLYHFPTDRAGIISWFQRIDEIDDHTEAR